MTDIKTAIGFATQGNAVEFNGSVKDMLSQRAVDAITQRREVVSQSVFNAAVEEEPAVEIADDELEAMVADVEQEPEEE